MHAVIGHEYLIKLKLPHYSKVQQSFKAELSSSISIFHWGHKDFVKGW